MKKIVLFLLLFHTISFCLSGDDKTERELNYKIRRVSPEGGLGTNGQRDVKQDKWGFIWVITVNYLYRFDGYTFKDYTEKLKESDAAATWSFKRLEIDKNGDIYIAGSRGLLKYNPLKDDFDCLFQADVNLVEEDIKERLWISDPSTMGLFDRQTQHFTPIESNEGTIANVSAICAKTKDIYAGTTTGKIYLYEEEKKKFRPVFHQPEYNIVDISNTGSLLYLLTENRGLRVISTDTYKEIKQYDFIYPDGDQRVSARALFIDKFGDVWITGQRGIYILDPKTENYVHYYYDKTDLYGLPSSSVWRISEDNQGNLWFGTYSGGLCFINLDEQRNMKSFNGLTDGLDYPVVSSFEEDNRYLWIGTEGGGLNRYDKQTGAFVAFKHNADKNSLSYDNIQSLLFTENHKLWKSFSPIRLA